MIDRMKGEEGVYARGGWGRMSVQGGSCYGDLLLHHVCEAHDDGVQGVLAEGRGLDY